jgi:hypothetical protein
MKRHLRSLALLPLACLPAWSQETVPVPKPLYVNDKLVVGVYPDVDSEEGKIANLETGDAVEELERQERHVRIRLNDGREGWVRAGYLSPTPPAIVRLKELQAAVPPAAVPQNSAELTQLREQNSALQEQIDDLKQVAARAAATTKKPEPPRVDALPPIPAANSREMTAALPWWSAAVVATGVLGFVIGYQTLARRIRRKYGRVKIY